MFEKFLERSGNSIKLEEFSEDYIRQYNNLVSEKLIYARKALTLRC